VPCREEHFRFLTKSRLVARTPVFEALRKRFVTSVGCKSRDRCAITILSLPATISLIDFLREVWR